MPANDRRDRGFPSTHWSLLGEVAGAMSSNQRVALDTLIRRYRCPVYNYVRGRGFNRDEAEDLVQEFFANWLARGLFGRADRTRGRFRDYLLASLRNFMANELRRRYAKRRWPDGGFLALDVDQRPGSDSPASGILRAHTAAITREVLATLEDECRETGKQAHFEIFRLRMVLPALEGAEPVPMRALGARFELSEKQAANHLLTARRAYRRLLEARVSEFAASPEDLAAEMQELTGHLEDRPHRRTAAVHARGNDQDPGGGSTLR